MFYFPALIHTTRHCCYNMSSEEQHIINAFISGSHDAFEHIYNRYSAAIYANIRRLVKPADAAEDILQDVFTVLWTNRAALNPAQPVGNWLFVVSYNRAVSYLKKKLRENIDLSAEIAAADIPDEAGTDEAFYGEQVMMLENAIERLPRQKQRVFRLYYFEHKSCETIAAELNLSVSSVKFYLKQSRALVRNCIHAELSHAAGMALLLFIIQQY